MAKTAEIDLMCSLRTNQAEAQLPLARIEPTGLSVVRWPCKLSRFKRGNVGKSRILTD